jgi:hypothetical protein
VVVIPMLEQTITAHGSATDDGLAGQVRTPGYKWV